MRRLARRCYEYRQGALHTQAYVHLHGVAYACGCYRAPDWLGRALVQLWSALTFVAVYNSRRCRVTVDAVSQSLAGLACPRFIDVPLLVPGGAGQGAGDTPGAAAAALRSAVGASTGEKVPRSES